jgi:hypothetical protein
MEICKAKKNFFKNLSCSFSQSLYILSYFPKAQFNKKLHPVFGTREAHLGNGSPFIIKLLDEIK